MRPRSWCRYRWYSSIVSKGLGTVGRFIAYAPHELCRLVQRLAFPLLERGRRQMGLTPVQLGPEMGHKRADIFRPERRLVGCRELDPHGRGFELAILAPLRRGVGPFHRSEEHTSELQSRRDLVCRLLLEKKK